MTVDRFPGLAGQAWRTRARSLPTRVSSPMIPGRRPRLPLMTQPDPSVSVSRDIDAPAHDLFKYLAQPASHTAIDGGTRVTEFYDLSAAPEWLHKATKEGERWRSGMEASLSNLAKATEQTD